MLLTRVMCHIINILFLSQIFIKSILIASTFVRIQIWADAYENVITIMWNIFIFNEVFVRRYYLNFLHSGMNLSYVCENKLQSVSFSVPTLVKAFPICFRLVDGNERHFRTQDFRCLHVCCVHVCDRERKSITCGRILKVRHYYRSRY
jgi:hypothetical protein